MQAGEKGGRLELWRNQVAECAAALFIPPRATSGLHGYQPPAELLESLDGAKGKGLQLKLEGTKHAGNFATSFVHDDRLREEWSGKACKPLASLIQLLASAAIPHAEDGSSVTSVPSAHAMPWLIDWAPLLNQQHGDLNLANILVDVRGSIWLIDVRTGAPYLCSAVLLTHSDACLWHHPLSLHLRYLPHSPYLLNLPCPCMYLLYLLYSLTLSALPRSRRSLPSQA